MFAITVTEKGGAEQRLDFDKAEVTIGRVKGNDIVLPKGNVSKRHARVVLKDGKFIVVDLKSTNGTYVNGRKITSPLVVKQSDKIYIGDFVMSVDDADDNAVDAVEEVISPPPPMPPPGFEGEEPGGPKTVPPVAPPVRDRPESRPPLLTPGGRRARPSSMPAPRSRASERSVSQDAPSVRPPRPAPRRSQPPPASVPEIFTPHGGGGRERMAERASSVPPPAMEQVANIAESSVAARLSASANASASEGGRIEVNGQKASPLGQHSLSSVTRRRLGLQREILDKLDEQMGTHSLSPEKLGEEAIWQQAETSVIKIVDAMESDDQIPSDIERDVLIKESLNEALGLGALEDLLADDLVDEILVDKRDCIVIGRRGALRYASSAFSSNDCFQRVVQRLIAPAGKTINADNPVVGVHMGDGTAIVAAFPPVSVHGACLSLRKPRRQSATLDDLSSDGALSSNMAEFLSTVVTARKNILVCGAASSGKNQILSALASNFGRHERLISVDGSGELAIDSERWVALESGIAHAQSRTQLLRTALAMHSERLVVSDLRGPEAMTLAQAMSSTHDGTLVSVGSDHPLLALSTMAELSRLDAPGASIMSLRALVASAIQIVVHVARFGDDKTKVASIHEVVGVSDDGFSTREIFSIRDGESFAASGVVPRFYADLDDRGVLVDTSIFSS